jgi:hypothetical protein
MYATPARSLSTRQIKKSEKSTKTYLILICGNPFECLYLVWAYKIYVICYWLDAQSFLDACWQSDLMCTSVVLTDVHIMMLILSKHIFLTMLHQSPDYIRADLIQRSAFSLIYRANTHISVFSFWRSESVKYSG